MIRNNRDGFLKKQTQQRYQRKKIKHHKKQLKYEDDIKKVRHFNNKKSKKYKEHKEQLKYQEDLNQI